MPHGALIRGGGWSGTILQADLAAFDANLTALINADDGGCWSLTNTLNLGGSGLQLTGPLVVARKGSLLTGASSGLTLTVVGNVPAWPQYDVNHAGRTHSELIACAEGRPVPAYMWRCRRTDGAMQSIAPSFTDSKGVTQSAKLVVPVRARQNATLSQVTVNFRVSTPHAALPKVMPQVRVLRVDANGNAVAMTSVAAGAVDASGYVAVPKPSSGSSWYAQGGPQALVVTCDQYNTVDRTLYSYVVEILDEQLAGYPFTIAVKAPCLFNLQSYGTLTGLMTFDGVTATDGVRVLVTGQPDISQNAIWIAHAGAWTRAPDLQAVSDFSQGFLVGVQQGQFTGGTYWQPATTTATWAPGNEPSGTQVWSAGAGFTVGQTVTPSAAHANGSWYVCKVAGTSAASSANEPAWPTAPGSTVADGVGALVWSYGGQTATPLTFQTRPDGDTAPEGSALLAHGTIWQSLLVTHTNIVDGRFQ